MLTSNVRNSKFKQPSPGKLRPKTINDLKIVEKWRVRKHDKGSVDVEIGFLTEKIYKLEKHLILLNTQNRRAEFYRLRALLIESVNDRRKKLNYLMNTDTVRYHRALNLLKLSN